MKRAIMSELAIVRTLVPSIAGVGLFIFDCRAGNGRPWRCQLRHQHQGLPGTQPIGKRGIIGHAP